MLVIHLRAAHHSKFFLIPIWLSASLRPFAAMLVWFTLALIHLVLAVDSTATTNISSSGPAGSVSFTLSSNYGASSLSSATATSTVTTGSLTSATSGPSTQAQVNVPIKPTTFSPFPVPSDNPIPPYYPVVNPSQPPLVSYSRFWFRFLLELTHIFIGWLFWNSRFWTCVGSRIR